MFFTPSKDTLEKLAFINKLQDVSEKEGFKLWHCGSWAITAMMGEFFKDLNDVDVVVITEVNKKRLSQIVESFGLRFVAQHPWGPVEYTNGSFEVEFGSAEDKRNSFYKAIFDENNYGYINGIKLYIADPKEILQSRHDMIRAGYKQLDDTQKLMIKTVEEFIEDRRV